MRLKKIKIAGFKSFVDPTTVMVPSQLVAIVGPNGCGKSNIIDAISWVMGESSAKYLRGESSTDMIFNGSGARKPVGQASVELVFDNQDGTLGGEYAAYSEVSIRRVINREGDSSYFLNGTRCRRKDIIDIFLGTGLGPRSYSIIGQNMISRIIEAKPEEMRIYLEEAAGVSKYKERRRETENRIRHTQENLARLSDLQAELEKQLNSLNRQANAAEKYKVLKEEERSLRAEWLAIQWRQLNGRLVQSALQIQQQETSLEGRQTELTERNREIVIQRESHVAASDIFQDVQKRYYGVGSDISRIEQEIRHTQDRERQWQGEMKQVEEDCAHLNDTLLEIAEEKNQLVREVTHLEPSWQQSTEAVRVKQQLVAQAEQDNHQWQSRWDAFHQLNMQTTQAAEVEKMRIQHLEKQVVSLAQQKEKIVAEQEKIDVTRLQSEIHHLTQEAQQCAMTVAEKEEKFTDIRKSIQLLQETKQQRISTLDETKNQLQQLGGRIASLEALQQTALGQRDNAVVSWLVQQGLDQNNRFAQCIEVEAGWETAVEKVLGMHLQAICVEGFDRARQWAADFIAGDLSMVSMQPMHETGSAKSKVLLSKIKSSLPMETFLSGIYTAETFEEALDLSKSLGPQEWVVTREGDFFGASWLRFNRDKNPEEGVFQREQEIKQLIKERETLVISQSEQEKRIEQYHHEITVLEQASEEVQKALHEIRGRLAEVNAEHKLSQQRSVELQKKSEEYLQAQESNQRQLEEAQSDLAHAKNQWQQAMSELERQADTRDALMKERDQLKETLQSCRDTLRRTQEHAHELEIKLQSSRSQQGVLDQQCVRLQSQLATLEQRKELLQKEALSESLVKELEKTLETMLNQRLQVEEELQRARATLSTIEQSLRLSESQKQEIEREIVHYRDVLETLRVESQGIKVKSETLSEHIQETGLALETILQQLPEQAIAEEWQARVEQVAQRIARLGPINLVAIEEYATCLERKDYLDKQCADLNEGLSTLEEAIAKIDKETRARFKETFDTVNERFQILFPQIFGGGRAYLELTGENLLESGISVMACPPGKRNSTIHLLSGGEKAMTAISLVFSIFHLNPAPFCLLDEVDAPLDDANIGRFCQLVKNMSEKTQFIFISHNKLAIEMAEHLMGVTMHEPGVSRLVSVNVEEAVSLAGV